MSDPDLQTVLAELTDFLDQAAIAHSAAASGPRGLPEAFSPAPPFPVNPDPHVYLGIADPNLPDH